MLFTFVVCSLSLVVMPFHLFYWQKHYRDQETGNLRYIDLSQRWTSNKPDVEYKLGDNNLVKINIFIHTDENVVSRLLLSIYHRRWEEVSLKNEMAMIIKAKYSI